MHGSSFAYKGRKGKREEEKAERETKTKKVGLYLCFLIIRKQDVGGLQKHKPIVFTENEVIKDDCQLPKGSCESDITSDFPLSKRTAVSWIHPSVASLDLS